MNLNTNRTGIDRVTRFLAEEHVVHRVITHAARATASGDAQAVGIDARRAAKTVTLRTTRGFRVAIVPADKRLDMQRASDATGSPARLATEAEIASRFRMFEVGATPPLGRLLHTAVLMDRSLLKHSTVLCSGGDHQHGILVDPHDLVQLGNVTVADLVTKEEATP